eukprot:TRINITY_DN123417_c0_g1_i1.p1 TRINITY_DN123417_c0_g1~~TRINITY_DN123417_c0_g1_i1.p1  ORF type:complete len:302 (-),score=58.99 TRINITY_DN123417_c0_g1_i1:62-967(-)
MADGESPAILLSDREEGISQASGSEAPPSRASSASWRGGALRRRLSLESRSSSREREQFTASRQEAVQDAVLQVNSIYFSTMFLGFLVICLATYFEVRSVYVLAITYQQPCDRPLWYWLCGHVVLGILREVSSQPLKGVLLLLHVVWTGYGFMWFGKAHSCKSTSPILYEWVQIILLVASVFLAATTLLPLTFYLTVMVLIVLVNRGMISNQKAAREGTLERLQVVTYDANLFAPSDAPDDARPSGECCCCTEEFNAVEGSILCTPCGHYYHKDCIGDWLKLARTCPLCRCDLEEAVWSDA